MYARGTQMITVRADTDYVYPGHRVHLEAAYAAAEKAVGHRLPVAPQGGVLCSVEEHWLVSASIAACLDQSPGEGQWGWESAEEYRLREDLPYETEDFLAYYYGWAPPAV